MDIIVKYTYKMRAGGWDYPMRKRFESFGEALHWVMNMRESKKILGFRLECIEKDVKCITKPVPKVGHLARSAYRYEGSTDAELIGMRY